MALTLNEIFYSLQGESTYAGLPFVFIRLTGCNLRCRDCDTRYAYEEGSLWEVDAIIEEVERRGCKRATITGGEPLLQADTLSLVTRLCDAGYLVTLETNGSRDIEPVDRRCIKIMDIKCPSSGMQMHNRWDNLKFLSAHDQVKFVIADDIDFEFACQKNKALGKHITPEQILFSPVHGVLPAQRLAQWMLDTHLEARLQIQLHKYLWPEIDRGV